MSLDWKYKVALKDEGVYKKIEADRNTEVPKEVKDFIAENNGATPSKYKFKAGDDERVFGAVLSFNENEADGDSVFTALWAVEDKKLLPFGIDPFGNYICYRLSDKTVVFEEQESKEQTSTNMGLEEFINSLY